MSAVRYTYMYSHKYMYSHNPKVHVSLLHVHVVAGIYVHTCIYMYTMYMYTSPPFPLYMYSRDILFRRTVKVRSVPFLFYGAFYGCHLSKERLKND